MINNFEIKLAENSGFCFGVRRAVDMIYDLRSKTDKKIYTIGHLIHNELFIKRLEDDGIFSIEEEEISSLLLEKDSCVLVIRTHGIKKEIVTYLEQNGFEYVDATCPFVKRIHDIVDKNSKDADAVIIMGDKNHPEVVGIKSYSHTQTFSCCNEQELDTIINESLNNREKCILLASQTTFNNEKYVNYQNVVRKLYTNSKIFDTICKVTENRQNEVIELASKCDCVFVVGGLHSSNTRKLYEISRDKCKNTYLIQSMDDIDTNEVLKLYDKICDHNKKFTVGITAGASTPDDIIEEVKAGLTDLLLKHGEKTK